MLIVVRFDHNVTANEVRRRAEHGFDEAGDDATQEFEVKQFGPENQMRIVTQYKYDDAEPQRYGRDRQVCFTSALAPLYRRSR